MILKSLNKYISLLIITLSFSTLYGENEIDIWNKKKQEVIEDNKKEEINFEKRYQEKYFLIFVDIIYMYLKGSSYFQIIVNRYS